MSSAGEHNPIVPRAVPRGQELSAHQVRNREATSPVDEERTVTPTAASSAAPTVETPSPPTGFLGAGGLGPAGLPEVAQATRRYATPSMEPFKPFETGEIPVGELQRQARAWRWQRLAAVGLGSALGVGIVVAFFAALGLLLR